MRQIIGTASNHYDFLDASGDRHPSVELVIMSVEKEYECGASGLRTVEAFKTDRYYLRVDQLKSVIEQLHDIVQQAEELRGKSRAESGKPGG